MRWSRRYSSPKNCSALALGAGPLSARQASRRPRTSPPAQKALSLLDCSSTQATCGSSAQRRSAASSARIVSRLSAFSDFGASSVSSPRPPRCSTRSGAVSSSSMAPLRLALGEEGAHALGLVLCVEEVDEALALGGQRIARRLPARGLDQGLAGGHAAGALARRPVGQRERGG